LHRAVMFGVNDVLGRLGCAGIVACAFACNVCMCLCLCVWLQMYWGQE
jgi:hypothetical protein